MKEPTQKCMSHLEALRKNWLTENNNFQIKDVAENLSQTSVLIEDIEYSEDIYAEKSFEGITLIIFELSRPMLIGSRRHCLGIEICVDQSKNLLSEEELSERGIP